MVEFWDASDQDEAFFCLIIAIYLLHSLTLSTEVFWKVPYVRTTWIGPELNLWLP